MAADDQSTLPRRKFLGRASALAGLVVSFAPGMRLIDLADAKPDTTWVVTVGSPEYSIGAQVPHVNIRTILGGKNCAMGLFMDSSGCIGVAERIGIAAAGGVVGAFLNDILQQIAGKPDFEKVFRDGLAGVGGASGGERLHSTDAFWWANPRP